jgi:hypothetical protein
VIITVTRGQRVKLPGAAAEAKTVRAVRSDTGRSTTTAEVIAIIAPSSSRARHATLLTIYSRADGRKVTNTLTLRTGSIGIDCSI